MSNINDIIKDMPSIPASQSGGGNSFLAVQAIIKGILKALPEMLLHVNVKNNDDLSKDVLNLGRSLSSLERTLGDNDGTISAMFPELKKEMANLSASLKGLKFSEQKDISFPSKMDVTLSDAQIKSLTPKKQDKIVIPALPKTFNISNLSDVVGVVQDVESAIKELDFPKEIKIPNVKAEVKFPKALQDALKKLNLLSNDPKKPIAVRLSDGEQWGELIAKSVGQAVAMGPSPGNSVRSSFTSGALELTSATTAVQVTGTSTPITRVEISVLDGLAAVGDSNANIGSGTQQGTILYPGALPTVLYIDDLSNLYAAGATGTRLSYVYYV